MYTANWSASCQLRFLQHYVYSPCLFPICLLGSRWKLPCGNLVYPYKIKSFFSLCNNLLGGLEKHLFITWITLCNYICEQKENAVSGCFRKCSIYWSNPNHFCFIYFQEIDNVKINNVNDELKQSANLLAKVFKICYKLKISVSRPSLLKGLLVLKSRGTFLFSF